MKRTINDDSMIEVKGEWACTWKAFVEANEEAMTAGEFEEIRQGLQEEGFYVYNGGASGISRIEAVI